MFCLNISIDRFDYNKTFQALWPQLQRKINKMESDDMRVLLLQQMQDTALNMLLQTLRRMEEAQRNALFCRVIEISHSRIHTALTNALNSGLGQSVRFSGLRLHDGGDGRLTLLADGVEVNFDRLLKNERVVQALGGKAFLVKMAMPLIPLSQREKMLVNAVRQSKYQAAILSRGNQMLEEAGISLTISGLDVADGETEAAKDAESHNQPLLSTELSNALVDAFSDYLLAESMDE